jgi:hypothetical protein
MNIQNKNCSNCYYADAGPFSPKEGKFLCRIDPPQYIYVKQPNDSDTQNKGRWLQPIVTANVCCANHILDEGQD